MTVLVTGAGGFVGQYMVEALLARGDQVDALYRTQKSSERFRRFGKKLRKHSCDLLDRTRLQKIVAGISPDAVIHLAGLSQVSASWEDPHTVFQVHVLGTLNLLTSLRRIEHPCKILVVGSSDVYGKVPRKAQPVRESQPFAPVSPYGVSKAAQDLLALLYARSFEMDIVLARPFNHTGPGQREDFVVPSFALQLVRIEKGLQEPVIRTGNLKPVRDFTDVRDVVSAYELLLKKGRKGEAYHICRGQGHSISQMLRLLIKLSGISCHILRDPERERPVDIPYLVGSFAKIKRETGWKPKLPLQQTLKDMLLFFRRRLK